MTRSSGDGRATDLADPGQNHEATDPGGRPAPSGDEAAYVVGYGRPPLGHRFAPGRSGNPNGRPRKDQAFKALLQRELAERVLVKEAGRRRQLSKRGVIVKRLVGEAMAGNPKHLAIVLSHDPIVAEVLGEVSAALTGPPDVAVKAGLVGRLRAALAFEPEPSDITGPIEADRDAGLNGGDA